MNGRVLSSMVEVVGVEFLAVAVDEEVDGAVDEGAE